MLEFIKMFGLGILYTILSPIILLFFLLFVIYSIGNYFVFEVINLSGFFLGKKFTSKTKLDEKLEKMRKDATSAKKESVEEIPLKEKKSPKVKVAPKIEEPKVEEPKVEESKVEEQLHEESQNASPQMINRQIDNINEIVDKEGDIHE